MTHFYRLCLVLILANCIEYSTEYDIDERQKANLIELGEKINKRESHVEHWIEVPLDHFNLFDNRTWKMKCFFNAKGVKENLPIFIEIGGEWTVSEILLMFSPMSTLADIHGGLVIATEHRYYGDSLPFGKNCSTENLKYLQIEQALEDLAYVIDKVKKYTLSLKNSPVIVHGCSYGGILARRFRLKYPHLVDVAYASSAPAWFEMTYPGYYEMVNDVYANVSQECRDTIKQGFEEMHYLMQKNPEKVRDALRDWACDNVDDMSEFQIAEIIRSIINVQFDPAAYEEVGCIALTMNKDQVGPFGRLAKFVVLKTNDQFRCPASDDSDESFDEQPPNTKHWTYQVCTEIGSFTIYNSSDPHVLYDVDWTEEEMHELCKTAFGDEMTEDLLRRSIEGGHRRYGKALPAISRVVSTVGVNDPWVRLGYPDASDPESPLFVLKGSHCTDLKWDRYDPEDLQDDRKKVLDLISKWIKELSQEAN